MSTVMEITIPSDNDGYILLKCPLCVEYFKIETSKLKDDKYLEIYCPSCGLSSDNYLTDDVIELAMNMADNYMIDTLYEEFKKLERKSKKGVVRFSVGKKPKAKPEMPIHFGIQALEKTRFECCHSTAKVKPLLKMTGCYCPFCGVKEYETE